MKGTSPRLHVSGNILGYQRSKRHQNLNATLVSIEGVRCKEDAQYYLGKRVAYVYSAKTKRARLGPAGKEDTKKRVIWGRVARPHGNSGVVRVRFAKNIPPHAFGAPCRVMMYPSTV